MQSRPLVLTPLCLRLALGAVFIWAGCGKLFYNQPYQGEAAAVLANLGIIPGPSAAAPSQTSPPSSPPSEAPAPEPKPDDGADKPAEPEQPTSPPAFAATSSAPAALGTYTAADFPEPREALRLYGLTLLLDHASRPDDQGRTAWPAFLATPTALKLMPWVAAVTELLGGSLVLLGFMTRFWALGLACTMGVAMWLTQIHPAIASGDAFWGFLPQPMMDDPSQYANAWKDLLLQFTLLMSALGLVFGGAGMLSMDWMLFRPRAAAPKPKAA